MKHSQKKRDREAQYLDMLVRLAHPDWFISLTEYAMVWSARPNINNYALVVEKLFVIFGADLIQSFIKPGGVENPAKWWREYIVEIADRSDNETVIEARNSLR